MKRERILAVLKQRILPIIGKCLITGIALAVYIISNIIVFIWRLERKGKIRLAISVVGCFLALVLFVYMKESGCAPAFIKSIAFSCIAIVILTSWLEFFGVDVILGRDNAE